MDEANIEDHSGDRILQRGHSRNTVRSLAMESAMRMPEDSSAIQVFKGLYNLVKILVCSIILHQQSRPLEKPLDIFVLLIIIVSLIALFNVIVKLISFRTEISNFMKVLTKLMVISSIM